MPAMPTAQSVRPAVAAPRRPVFVTWQPDVMQRLESSHAAAWSNDQTARERFEHGMTRFVQRLDWADVRVVDAATVHSLADFTHQIEHGERQLAAEGDDAAHVEPSGRSGLIAALRRNTPWRRAAVYRVLLVRNADALLARDPALFAACVDTISGVAAELEFADDGEPVRLLRAVYMGGPALDLYAEDPRGAFGTWLSELRSGNAPYWRLVSGLEAPSVEPMPIDDVLARRVVV